MNAGIADTSGFIARESGRPLEWQSLPERVGISVITIGELRAGVLAASTLDLRDRRLATLTAASALAAIPVDERVAEAWAHLRVSLRDAGLRMGLNSSWIAATALAHGVPVITQDADYAAVAGLEVIRV